MYYKIKNNILFRYYGDFGYLTDNSMFGYSTYGAHNNIVGEKFVSKSGAMMLNALSKAPQDIDSVVEKIKNKFNGVKDEILRNDTIEFFDSLVQMGYLNSGIDIKECAKCSESSYNSVKNYDCNNKCFPVSDSVKIIENNIYLRSLHIEVTNRCNERCVHCYIPHKYKTKIMSPDLFFKIVREGRDMNIINVTLSGGEPLCHNNIVEFLKYSRNLDLSVNLLSNLTLLTDEITEELIKNPLLSVQTSVYSLNNKIHDSITNKKGSLEQTIANCELLQNIGVPLQISCPIMKQNLDSFHDVVRYGQEHGIPVVTDYSIFASCDTSNCNLKNRLSLEDISFAFDNLASDEYVKELLYLAAEKEKLSLEESVCTICRYYICVSAEGLVYPCVGWNSHIIGDLKNQSLNELWNNSKAIKNLRSIKINAFKKCTLCNDRGYCTICMMSNYNENKDIYSISDHHCSMANLLKKKVKTYLNSNIKP